MSNAVYHKSYEIGAPIEIQVWPDKIEILSYPGPVPPVDVQLRQHQKRIVARDYRNRRIGDFLKELRLTEGRGTGFPTIYRAMDINGSPEPTFDTDDDCTYFLAVLLARTEVEEVTKGISGEAKAENKAIGLGEGVNEGVNEQALLKVIGDTFPASSATTREGIRDLVIAIAKYERRRVPEYLQITGLAHSTIERYIR